MTHRQIASSLLAVALAACSRTATVTGGPPVQGNVAVSVTPAEIQVAPGDAVLFTADVTGATVTTVTWSVDEPGGGTVERQVDGTGRYVAPGAAGVFHVRATTVALPAATDAATVTVTAPQEVTFTLLPLTAAVDACQTVPFVATVTGSSNQAVTWTIQEGAAGGAVSTGGVYTAPSAGGIYHVIATPSAAPAKAITATVTVTERIVSVQVSPSAVTVPLSGTTQLSATVTTTCGTFPASAVLTPSGAIVPR